MRCCLLSSSSFVVELVFLAIATHYCKHILGSTIDGRDDNLFALDDLEQQDLFSNNNIFDDSSPSSSIDLAISQPEENIGASSLEPIGADIYTSAADNSNAIMSSPSPTLNDAFLSSADVCLTGDQSLSEGLFARSPDETTVVEAPPNFCFQKPDTEKLPPLTLPNLFDLLQPDDQNDPLAPFDTFPRRPVCPGRNFMHLLCCERDREKETGFVWDCEKCMSKVEYFSRFLSIFRKFAVISLLPRGLSILKLINSSVRTVASEGPKCQERLSIWCCATFIVKHPPLPPPLPPPFPLSPSIIFL